jgi:hypothetical protein
MARTWVSAAVLAFFATACTTTGVGHGSGVSPPPPNVTPSLPPSPSPTASPGPASPLVAGTASLSLSGDVTRTVVLATLGAPAVWAPPPAPMDLTWVGPAGEQLRLAGTSFLSLVRTGAEHTLSLTINGTEGPLQFSSIAGECSVTINPALPDNMGGIFTCTGLIEAAGTTRVDARGVFSASG